MLGGSQAPFVFDIESEWRDLRARARMVVDETPLPAGKWQHKLNQMVTSYLVHHGYADTARVLARDMNTTIDEPEETIAARQRIRDSVMSGNIEGAIELVGELFPTVFPDNPTLLFRLHCRRFIEMISDAAQETAGSADNRFASEHPIVQVNKLIRFLCVDIPTIVSSQSLSTGKRSKRCLRLPVILQRIELSSKKPLGCWLIRIHRKDPWRMYWIQQNASHSLTT